MNTLTKTIKLSVLLVALSVFNSSAGEISIEWNDLQKYTDVRAGEENKYQFQKRVEETLEQYVEILANKLPEGQKPLYQHIESRFSRQY